MPGCSDTLSQVVVFETKVFRERRGVAGGAVIAVDNFEVSSLVEEILRILVSSLGGIHSQT